MSKVIEHHSLCQSCGRYYFFECQVFGQDVTECRQYRYYSAEHYKGVPLPLITAGRSTTAGRVKGSKKLS